MIKKSLFGILPNGLEVSLFCLQNRLGMQVDIINYGAIVTKLFVPDRYGDSADVVLGYNTLEEYVNDTSYMGAIVGRVGNRIAKGRFCLDGIHYQLNVNDGENHLHGGINGFNKTLWTAEVLNSESGDSIRLKYVSRDGEEGYPGTVSLSVTYTLTETNELVITYEGTTDKPTILNPTHHSYFNLTGNFSETILDHQLQIDADNFTPSDGGRIPTGELAMVDNGPLDFRNSTPIGLHIDDNGEQMEMARGYDHNWVLRNTTRRIREVAELYEQKSGRCMTVYTDQPGLQFYSGNFLNNGVVGKKGVQFHRRTGLCLEAQGFPDAPNKPQFPSVVVRPGNVYRQQTIYKFSAK